MRKLIILLIVFMVITNSGVSNNYYFGLIGGLNYSEMDLVTMRIDQSVDYKTDFGYGVIVRM